MDTDDLEPRQAKTAFQLGQDLSGLSVAELGERIESLKAEIIRCENAIRSKQGSRKDAESVFKI